MDYKSVITLALSMAIFAGTGLAAASASDLRRDGYRSRATPEAVRRSLLPATRPGSAYRGAGPAPHLGGDAGSGWYQPGFGGTLNPGWGYNVGPNVGGIGR
jgi:hypothetical protein